MDSGAHVTTLKMTQKRIDALRLIAASEPTGFRHVGEAKRAVSIHTLLAIRDAGLVQGYGPIHITDAGRAALAAA
jgi:hypothetical protein